MLPVAPAWLRIAVDLALAALVFVVELGPVVAGAPPWNLKTPAAVDVIQLIGISAPLAVRRRFPVAVLAIGIASFWNSDLLGFGLAVTFYSVGAWCHRLWVSRVSAVLGAVATTAVLVVDRNVSLPLEALLPFGAFMLAWFIGHMIHLRRHYTGALEERARSLEIERAESERRAAAAERARIARDLHDIVAHRVSMMTVQAGAARVVADSDPEAAARALALLEGAGRQTLWELRRLMGVLRDEDATAPLDPQPRLQRLDELAERMRDAGVPVRITTLGDMSDVPEAVEVSAYRIVQEALTNVLKHAGPGAEADVIVRCSPSSLEIEVRDSGRGTSDGRIAVLGGHGLIGMRERAAVFGGSVQYGARPEGGFAVTAKIPTAQGDA